MSLHQAPYDKNMSLINIMASMTQGFSPDKRIFYQIIKGGSLRGKEKLFDSLGYSYIQNYSSAKGYCTWICSARNSAMSCSVVLRQDGFLFTRGEELHIHSPRPNEYIHAIIQHFLKTKVEEGDAKDFSTVWPMILDEFKIPNFYVNGAWYSQLERYFYKLKEESMNLYFNSGNSQNQNMEHGAGTLPYNNLNSMEEPIGNSDGDPSILEFIMQITSHCAPASTLFDSGNSSMNSSSSCLSGSEMENSAIVKDVYGRSYANVNKDFGMNINQGESNESNNAYFLDVHKNNTVINDGLHLNKLSEEPRKHDGNIGPSLLENENGSNSSYNMAVNKESMQNTVLGNNCAGDNMELHRSPFLIDCFKDIISEEENARYHGNAAPTQPHINKPPDLMPDNPHLNYDINNQQSGIFAQQDQSSVNNKWEHVGEMSTAVPQNKSPPEEDRGMMEENMARSDNCRMDNEIANFITEKESLVNTFQNENANVMEEGHGTTTHSLTMNQNLKTTEEESSMKDESADNVDKCPLSLINNILERENSVSQEYNDISDAEDDERSIDSTKKTNEQMFDSISNDGESSLPEQNSLHANLTENILHDETRNEDSHNEEKCKISLKDTESSLHEKVFNQSEGENSVNNETQKEECRMEEEYKESLHFKDSEHSLDEEVLNEKGESIVNNESQNEDLQENSEPSLGEEPLNEREGEEDEQDTKEETPTMSDDAQCPSPKTPKEDEQTPTSEETKLEDKESPESPLEVPTTNTQHPSDNNFGSTTASKRKVDKSEDDDSSVTKKSKLDSEPNSESLSEPMFEEDAYNEEEASSHDIIIGEAFTINEEQLKELEDVSDTEPPKTFKPMCTIPEDMKDLIPNAMDFDSNGLSSNLSLGFPNEEMERIKPAVPKHPSKKSKKKSKKPRRNPFFKPLRKKKKKKSSSLQPSSKSSLTASPSSTTTPQPQAQPEPQPQPQPRSLEVLPAFLQEVATIDASLVVLRDRVDEFGTKVRVACITFHETVLDWAFSDTLLSSSFDNAKSLRTRYSLNSKLNLLFPEEVDYEDMNGFHPVDLGPMFPFAMPDVKSKTKEKEEGEKSLEKVDLPFPLEQLSFLCPSSVSKRKVTAGEKSLVLQSVPFADEPLEWAFKETFMSSFSDSPILSDLLGLSSSTKKWPDVAEEILSNEGVDHTFPFACPNSKKYLENLLFNDLSASLPPSLLHETLDIPAIPPDVERRLCSERDALCRLLALATFYKHISCVPTVRSNRKLSVSHAALVASFRPLIISQANKFAFTVKDARARLLKGLACQDKNIIPALIRGPMHSRRGCLFSNIQKLEAAVAKDPNNKLQYM